MRNARMHQLKLAAVLLCALSAGASGHLWAAPANAPAPKATVGGFVPPKPLTGNVIDSILVIVNDEVITRQELAGRVKTVARRMKAQNAAMPDAADLERQVLERMIV